MSNKVRILFIGNSHTYVNDLPLTVREMAETAGYDCEVRMIAHGGWFLEQHVNEPDTRFEILHGRYDYVVLQEHSHPFAPEQKYEGAVKALCEMIRSAGSIPVIYATWSKKTEPEVQEYMNSVNRRLTLSENALMAPVGFVWWGYQKSHPDTEMYASDGEHASKDGSRLAAQVIWLTISGHMQELASRRYQKVIDEVYRLADSVDRLLITVDGPCASGKTTLASELAACMDGVVVHTDDFVVPHAAKTKERLAIPGGNCDWERLVSEVVDPFCRGEKFAVRKYSCSNDSYLEPEEYENLEILILEGSYSNLPEIRKHADIRVFVDAAASERYARLERRESAESLRRFGEMWIPLENAYFSAYKLPDEGCIIINDREDGK